MAELARLEVELVSPRELQKAKTQLEVSLVNGLATNHALASRVGRDFASFGRIRPLEERLDAIRAVTAEDIQRVAREYLKSEGRTVVQVVAPVAEEGGGA
jgi:zinc protease